MIRLVVSWFLIPLTFQSANEWNMRNGEYRYVTHRFSSVSIHKDSSANEFIENLAVYFTPDSLRIRKGPFIKIDSVHSMNIPDMNQYWYINRLQEINLAPADSFREITFFTNEETLVTLFSRKRIFLIIDGLLIECIQKRVEF